MENKRNVGLDLLKVFMTLEVVLVHGWSGYTFPYQGGGQFPWSFFNRTGTVAVPAFILLSFIFTDIEKIAASTTKLKERLLRLCIPQIAWTIIYFVLLAIFAFITESRFDLTWKDLTVQMLFGCRYNDVMWFQVVLIILTLLFCGLAKFFIGKSYIDILILMFFTAFVLQYSGINEIVFKTSFVPVLGRICETIPVAIIGLFFSRFKLLRFIKNNRKHVGILSLAGLFMIYSYDVFTLIDGFAYSGLWRTTAAFLYVLLFSAIPFENVSDKIVHVVRKVAICTPAVYYVQRIVLTYINKGRLEFSACCLMMAGIIFLDIICLKFINNKSVRAIFI